MIAEQAKWSHDSWRSDIPPAITQSEVWGVNERRLIGGLIGETWDTPSSPILSNMEVDVLWSSGEQLWWLADQRLWRASSLINNTSESEIGYAPSAVSGEVQQVMKMAVYTFGGNGFSAVVVELTPAWRLSGTTLTNESIEASIKNLI